LRWSVPLGVLIILVGIAAGALVVWSGVVDVAATNTGGPGLADRVLGYAAVRSIRHHAKGGQNPTANDPAALKAGLQQYRMLCVACHGGPGAQPAKFAAGLYPPAPDLTSASMQAFSDAMLYQTIAGGIGSTGMPAFGPTHEPREIWSIVAAVRHLDALRESAESPNPSDHQDTGVHRISISNFKFEPAALDVQAGDIVEWTNADFVAHTATADDRSFDTGTLEGGESKRVVTVKAGTFSYSCRYHSGMKAALRVH
jgi:plastocyanin